MNLTLGELVNIFTVVVMITLAFSALKYRNSLDEFKTSLEGIIEKKLQSHEEKIFSHIETELLRHENKELKSAAETEKKFTALLSPIRADISKLYTRQDKIIELKGLSKDEVNKE